MQHLVNRPVYERKAQANRGCVDDTSRSIDIVVRGPRGIAEGKVCCALRSPGLFGFGNQRGALATHQDGVLVGIPGTFPNALARPAKPGDVITLWATGLGPVSPAVRDGSDSKDTLRTVTVVPEVRIGNLPATVIFAGLSPEFPGVNQVNVVVPPGVQTGDEVPLIINAGGNSDAARTIAIGQ